MVLLDAAVLIVSFALLWHRHQDARDLAAFVGALRPLPRDERGAALAIASACYGLPRREALGDPVLLPWLGALGATPGAVLRHGGCCSGRSRLLIVALALLRIRAFQITLYHRSGRAHHCLVQACVAGEPLIMDPSYGLFYVTPDGRGVGLAELQEGTIPRFQPLPGVNLRSYPTDDYYAFDFRQTRTANWTRSVPRRLCYTLLALTLGDRARRIEVPAALEWPQNVLVLAAVGLLAAAHILASLV